MRIVCEMCGNSDFIKDRGVFVCQDCGCKYTLEEARKLMVDGAVKQEIAEETSSQIIKDEVANKKDNEYKTSVVNKSHESTNDKKEITNSFSRIVDDEAVKMEQNFAEKKTGTHNKIAILLVALVAVIIVTVGLNQSNKSWKNNSTILSNSNSTYNSSTYNSSTYSSYSSEKQKDDSKFKYHTDSEVRSAKSVAEKYIKDLKEKHPSITSMKIDLDESYDYSTSFRFYVDAVDGKLSRYGYISVEKDGSSWKATGLEYRD